MLQNERAQRGWPSCIYQGEPTAQEPALTFRDCAPPEPRVSPILAPRPFARHRGWAH
jgi:hypothetical protein